MKLPSSLRSQKILGFLLIILLVSSHCVEVHNVVKVQNELQRRRRHAKITPNPNDVRSQRRNAIVPGDESYDALTQFQTEVGIPTWAFRIYLQLSAAETFVGTLVNEVKKQITFTKEVAANVQPFLSEMLTKKIGLEISANAESKVRPKFYMTSWKETQDKFKDVSAVIAKNQDKFYTAVGNAVVKQLVKAVLKYLFLKLLQGAVSLAIPGAGILIAIYKLYKMVEVNVEKKADKNKAYTFTICIEAAALADIGNAKVCIEIDFVSSVFAAIHDKYLKLKSWFKDKKDKIKSWFKKKKPSKSEPQESEFELGEAVSAAGEAITESKVSDMFEFTNAYSELLDISDVFSEL